MKKLGPVSLTTRDSSKLSSFRSGQDSSDLPPPLILSGYDRCIRDYSLLLFLIIIHLYRLALPPLQSDILFPSDERKY